MNKYGPVNTNIYKLAHWARVGKGAPFIYLGGGQYVSHNDEKRFLNDPNYYPTSFQVSGEVELIKNPPMKPFERAEQVLPLMEQETRIYSNVDDHSWLIKFVGKKTVLLSFPYDMSTTFQDLFDNFHYKDGRPVGMDGDE